jgi:hypothetical protein
MAKGKIVVIGEKCTITADEVLSREVMVEKIADGKESLKITIKAPTRGGGGAGPSQDCRGDDKATQSSATD